MSRKADAADAADAGAQPEASRRVRLGTVGKQQNAAKLQRSAPNLCCAHCGCLMIYSTAVTFVGWYCAAA